MTDSVRRALAELVACAEASVPYLALNTEGYRWHDAIVAARAALYAQPAEPESDAFKPQDTPGLGDDVACEKCGEKALDTGLECDECGHDNYEAVTGKPFTPERAVRGQS